ncbi:MAG: hypothetical protein R3345_12565 [Fulvivirga sp.]|nr:hypothetical protein [Fulvivirga sp.]
MEEPKITDTELLEYIDGTLSLQRRQYIQQQLGEDRALQARLDTLKEVDSLLSDVTQLSEPSNNFAAGVMNSLDRSSIPIRKSGLILLLVTVVTVLTGAYFMVDIMLNVSGVSQINYVQDIGPYLPDSIDLKTINIALLTILSFLGLMIFDKTVLRPMFKS